MDDGTAYCKAKRRGEPEQVRTFSDSDAKIAGLLGKQGPWMTGPKRMKQMRARGFALRDVFTDVLRGMGLAEEAMDTPQERNMGEVVQIEKPAGLPNCPSEKFAENMLAWVKAVQTGRATSDGIIAKAKTKYTLTDNQIKTIQSIKPVEDAKPSSKPDSDGVIQPTKTFDEVMTMICSATTEDALYVCGGWIEAISSDEEKTMLNGKFDERLTEIQGA